MGNVTVMTIGDWVLIGSVIVALVLGIRSIRHSSNLRKQDHKQRLLNEIIEWATDTVNVAFGTPMEASYLEGSNVDKVLHLGNKHLKYQAIETKGFYVTRIAEHFGNDLHKSILKVNSALIDVLTVISKRIKYGLDNKEKSDRETKCEYALRESALNLMQSATDIKVKLLTD